MTSFISKVTGKIKETIGNFQKYIDTRGKFSRWGVALGLLGGAFAGGFLFIAPAVAGFFGAELGMAAGITNAIISSVGVTIAGALAVTAVTVGVGATLFGGLGVWLLGGLDAGKGFGTMAIGGLALLSPFIAPLAVGTVVAAAPALAIGAAAGLAGYIAGEALDVGARAIGKQVHKQEDGGPASMRDLVIHHAAAALFNVNKAKPGFNRAAAPSNGIAAPIPSPSAFSAFKASSPKL